MTHQVLHDIIRTRFKNQVQIPQAISVAFDNAPFTKPDNTIWCRWTILTAESFQASIGGGTNIDRTPGVCIAQIFGPIEAGDKNILTLADVIKGAFRRTTDTGVVFKVPSVTIVGRTENLWQVNVSCPFYADNVA